MNIYNNISWIPIDVPPMAFKQELISEFGSFYTTYARQAQRYTKHKDDYGVTTWNDNLTDVQEQLKAYVDAHLPFTDLVNIKLQRLFTNDVIHYDFMSPDKNEALYYHNRAVEPCGYRFVLSGTRQGDLSIIEDDVSYFPTLPEDTDCYALGHTNSLHACVNFKPDRYILFCHGWIDVEKHYAILERSVQKYKEFAVYRKTSHD